MLERDADMTKQMPTAWVHEVRARLRISSLTLAKAVVITLALAAITGVLSHAVEAQEDLTLASIVLPPNNGFFRISEGKTEYTAWVMHDRARIVVNATSANEMAIIGFLDNDENVLADADTTTTAMDVDLDHGVNILKIRVSSDGDPDGNVYTLTIIRIHDNPEEPDPNAAVHKNLTAQVMRNARGFHTSLGTNQNFSNRKIHIEPATYDIRAILSVDNTFSDDANDFTADTIAVCFARHTPPMHSMRFEIGGESFPLDESTRAEGQHHCYQWPRPDGMQWAQGDGVPVKVFEDPTSPVPGNRPARGTLRLTASPSAIPGATLTANLPQISDWNGTTRAEAGEEGYAYTFEWTRIDDDTREDVTGADAADGRSSSYELDASEDWGKTHWGTIRFRDDRGHYEILTSNEVYIPAPSYGTQSTYHEETTIWTATLNPAEIETGIIFGCLNSSDTGKKCSEATVLTEDEMNVDGTTVTVSQVSIVSDGRLTLHASGLTANTSSALVLVVNGVRFPFSKGIESATDQIFWVGHGITPAVGTTVNLQLVRPSITATLTQMRGYEEPLGSPVYRFDLTLSQRVHILNQEMRNHTFEVTNGTIFKTKRVNRVTERVNGRRRAFSNHYEIHLRPVDDTTTTVVSLPVKNCSAEGALCTREGAYPDAASMLTLGTPTELRVSVADVTAQESTKKMVFTITATRTSDSYIHVHYETRDGTAEENVDYRPASGFTVIAPGNLTATIVVRLIDDMIEDSGETFTLALTNAEAHDITGTIRKPVPIGVEDPATGTILNHEATGTMQDADTSENVPTNEPTASFGGVPANHEAAEFTVGISFNEEFGINPATLEQAISVDRGTLTSTARTGEESDQDWTLTITPAGNDDVTITLARNSDCSATGALCTEDGRPIARTISITVEGPADSQSPANQPAAGVPVVSGTPSVGQTLTASTDGVTDANGMTGATLSYQWVRTDDGSDTDISGATANSYTLVEEDEGTTIKVRVSFTDDDGHSESLTSAATAEVQPKPNSPATGRPAISGTARVGGTLTATMSAVVDEDGLDNAEFAFQWLRTDGSTDTEISGATGTEYTLVNGDKGKTIKVRVSFTDDAGHEERLTSTATAAVLPPLLAASFHTDDTPENHDGQNAFTFELRFSEELSLSYKTLRDEAFTIDGGTVVKANRLVRSSNLRWRITVEPDSDAEVSVVLPVTTDCSDDGAICADDGRMLSNRTALTVAGPP